ncbi:MAG: hypothetical protein HQK58_17365 [Deltaproteobacteria bacterium]|nr:hypothetical protein [Deltaproteobacteria bacterium]
MRISVFLSYPKPHMRRQQEFINTLKSYLESRGMEVRTLGVTDYDMDAPLKAIRRLMLESNGLITVALRRTLVKDAILKSASDLSDATEEPLQNVWFSSPYCQIEPAMAYQLGLPILILREKGVIADGLLEKGAVGIYMPEFSLESADNTYLRSHEWNDLVGKWEGYVRSVVDRKGNPPKLY